MSSVVPEGWYETELHQFVNVSRGYAFKSSDYRSSGNPIVRVTNITNSNKLDLTDNIVFLDESRTKEFESYLLKNDDFLLVMVGATVGKYAEVNTKGRLLFLNQNMWRLSVHDGTNSQRFAIYGLQKVVEEFLGTMQGSAREFLTQKDFGKAPVLLPPLPEQKKIASILTSVDEVIENTQKQIDKLQDLKKATMNELLTKGIGHTEFKDSELGRIPKSWEVNSLGEYCNSVRDGTHDSPKRKINGYRLVTSKNLKSGRLDFSNCYNISEEDYLSINLRSKVQCNDILFGMIGTVGNPVIVREDDLPFAIKNVALLKLNSEKLASEWLFNYLDSSKCIERIEKDLSGSTQSFIGLGYLRSFLIPVPPPTERVEVNKIISAINDQVQKYLKKLAQTQSLKKSLMQDLLTGKVRVAVN